MDFAFDDFAFDLAYGDGDGDMTNIDQDALPSIEEAAPKRIISMDDVAKHNTPDDLWTVLHGSVYDLTKFAKAHIGGKKAITNLAGKDGTAVFAAAHGVNVLLSAGKDAYLGELGETSTPVAQVDNPQVPDAATGGDGSVAGVAGQTIPAPDDVSLANKRPAPDGGDATQDRHEGLSQTNGDASTQSSPKKPKVSTADGSSWDSLPKAIVLGGGLAGMSAACTVLESGGAVLLLDKSSFCGGNSVKATSGINGAGTRTQMSQGSSDSTEQFVADTLKGGAKRPELVKALCEHSGAAIDWLMDVFSLDLSVVARLGGHSQPRTHRGRERFPGMTITYAMIQMMEKVAEQGQRAKIFTKTRATELLKDAHGRCIGCVYERAGVQGREEGPVIIATGGFGADFSADSLLAQYRPDLLHLPTTNGEHCTGDGIKMGEVMGAKTIDLEWVQVHPTGLVRPDDPDAKIKLLAAEALRGVGGLLVDADGKRFINELGRRDDATREMWRHKAPFRLLLNRQASEEIAWHVEHYVARGVMKKYETGKQLADDMGVPVHVLADTHEAHYQAAMKSEKDPEGGPWPAYPSGKSWDDASGRTGSGKKFFKNVISGSQVELERFFVAIVTPVIHYCMGGLEVDSRGSVLGSSGAPIPGLYATGEVVGGVHGSNRLGGNSLLDCVVFGRLSGKACAEFMLGESIRPTSLAQLCTPESREVPDLKARVESEEMAVAKVESKEAATSWTVINGSVINGSKHTLRDVSKHSTKNDCWIVINGQVLDVTSFLGRHPGGEMSILAFAGKDATKQYDMIHPAGMIAKYAPEAVIGELASEADAVDGSSPATLPDLAKPLWCPCCQRPLDDVKHDKSTSSFLASCSSCGIDVSVKRQATSG